MTFIDQALSERFYHFGSNTYIRQRGEFTYPEEVSIGNNVFIRDGYWFNVVAPGHGNAPKIVIGDGTQCNLNFVVSAIHRVELEPNVLIGPNVYISDTDHEYRAIGIPVLSQWVTSTTDSVRIGEGSWIGANAVIVGNVKIGKGCVVGANSVVTKDVPDYCVVTGSPAKIMKMYDPAVWDWVRVKSTEAVEDILERRRSEPLLSICIPTYNRKADLERCLNSIYSQIGNTDMIEVRISDNASTDGTAEVIREFAERYTNLHHSRNEENIGGDPNILHVLQQGRGKFVKLQGDDDFFNPNTLIPFLHVLHTYKHCSVIHIDVHHASETVTVEGKQGLSEFLRSTSIFSSFITSTVLRREDLEKVGEPAKFLESSFNQIYLQYALLENNPHFCIVHSNMFFYAGNPPKGYNFGKVFMDSYQRILDHFSESGLDGDAVREDKRKVMFEFILPYYHHFVSNGEHEMIEDFEIYLEKHYGNEAYYKDILHTIRQLKDAKDGDLKET